jgi:hypothetical protein
MWEVNIRMEKYLDKYLQLCEMLILGGKISGQVPTVMWEVNIRMEKYLDK